MHNRTYLIAMLVTLKIEVTELTKRTVRFRSSPGIDVNINEFAYHICLTIDSAIDIISVCSLDLHYMY